MKHAPKILSCFALVAGISLFPAAQSHAESSKILAVFPFYDINADESDVEAVAEQIGELLNSKITTVFGDEADDALDHVDCGKDQQRDDKRCILAAARELKADYALYGSIRVTASLPSAHLVLLDTHTDQELAAKEYQMNASFKDFCASLPGTAANDFGAVITGASSATIITNKNGSEETSEPLVVNPVKPPELPPPDYPVVKGPTIGISGITAIGEVEGTQSQGGFRLRYIQPLSIQSQIRASAGVPMFPRNTMERPISGKDPDPYLGVEYEHHWRHFGIGGGLAYMMMWHYRSVHSEYNEYWDYNYYYDSTIYYKKIYQDDYKSKS